MEERDNSHRCLQRWQTFLCKAECVQVTTVESGSHEVKVVGYTCLALFAATEDGAQPSTRSVRDFGLNKGAVQLPLWPVKAAPQARMHASMLQNEPRLLCASLLVRLMTVGEAKAGRCA